MSTTCTKIFETQFPITCGGVSVLPGEIIIGDDDGIVVLNEQEIFKILNIAESIQQQEEKILSKIKDNIGLLSMCNFDEHYEKIRQKQQSQLVFDI